jgi:hypothetical protein
MKETTISPRGREIYLEEEIGASVSIPKNAIANDTRLGIATSISGSYDIPGSIKSVSPAYVVSTDGKVEFDKDVTMRMQHTASESEDLVLLVADATPADNRYEFRVSMDSRVECYAGKMHFGVIKVKSLFSQLLKIGKQKTKCAGMLPVRNHSFYTQTARVCAVTEIMTNYYGCIHACNR